MFEYNWATRSPNFSMVDCQPYLKTDSFTSMNISKRDSSVESLLSEGAAAPLLVNRDPIAAFPSKPGPELRRGLRRWYFNRQGIKPDATPAVKYRGKALKREAVAQENGYEHEGYKIWNKDPRVSNGIPRDATSATWPSTNDALSTEQPPSVTVERTDYTALQSNNQIMTPEKIDSTPEPDHTSEEGSEMTTINKTTLSASDPSIEITRSLSLYSSEDGETSDNLPMTPPATPGLDFKDQQAFFAAVADSNHPSVAREQFQRRQGVLWDGAIHVLQEHFLHPSDLTEPEFVTLVCSQGNETHTWLENNVMPIAHRSVRRWMDAHSMLADAGIYHGTVSNDLIHSFEWMSDEEQISYIEEYHVAQLLAVAKLHQISLSATDVEEFASLPITARSSFIKKYILTEKRESEMKSHSFNQVKLGKQDTVSLLEFESKSSESSASSKEQDAWIMSALEHSKSLGDDFTPRVVAEVAQYRHNIASGNSDTDALLKSKVHLLSTDNGLDNVAVHEKISLLRNLRGEDIFTRNRANIPPYNGASSLRAPLSHEFRALEIRTKPVVGTLPEPQYTSDTSLIQQTLTRCENSLIDDKKGSIDSGICMKFGSSDHSKSSSSALSSLLSTETKDSVVTPTRAIPTPRKVTPQRKLTPIPDITPYQSRSVQLHPSLASTISIDSAMLAISRMKPALPYEVEKSNSDYNEDCSIFNGENQLVLQGDKLKPEHLSLPSRVDYSRRMKHFGLRKRLSQVMLGRKVAEAEEASKPPQSLRKKISRVWGTVSLRPKRIRSGSKVE